MGLLSEKGTKSCQTSEGKNRNHLQFGSRSEIGSQETEIAQKMRRERLFFLVKGKASILSQTRQLSDPIWPSIFSASSSVLAKKRIVSGRPSIKRGPRIHSF
ncbi:hypothetical protein AVEN_99381-1 [Araneus ventricosus]|uniref:Uncharacterized protein n=1 Tax=Araneus ventricosus TaxID=182803 RepID=A0A4Y2GSN8_ARAVE|nr:hypothetical protein AVEN_99381-1 [Araneus ventricosus]